MPTLRKHSDYTFTRVTLKFVTNCNADELTRAIQDYPVVLATDSSVESATIVETRRISLTNRAEHEDSRERATRKGYNGYPEFPMDSRD